MTDPRLRRRNHGKGHSYQIDGYKVPGVTTVLNAMPKPALIDWASRVTAAAAVDRWDELADLPLSQRLRELERARWTVTKEAALRGTQIHDLGEKLANGLPVEVPPEHVGPVEAYARFLDEWAVDFIGVEAPCANTQYGYAGTLDAVAVIEKLGHNDPVLLDIKTGGVYNEAALQLAAYARCDLWQPRGPESEEPMPQVSEIYVAHVLPDAVELLPIVDDIDKLLLQFRYLLTTHRWIDAHKDDPAIGAAL